MYGVKSATSVGRAVSVLGVNTLRSISISLGYQQILSKKAMGGANFDRTMFSHHNLAVAIGAKAIARILSPAIMEEMYVTGLMHDIGILALDRFCPMQLNTAIKRAEINKLCLSQTISDTLGYDQYEVGAILSESWKLAPSMTNAIRFHNNPHGDPSNPLSTAIVIGANYLAFECGYPEMPGVQYHAEAEIIFKEFGLTEEQVETIKATIAAEIEQSGKTFGGQKAA